MTTSVDLHSDTPDIIETIDGCIAWNDQSWDKISEENIFVLDIPGFTFTTL